MKKMKKVLCVIMVIVMSTFNTTQLFALDVTTENLADSGMVETIISENFGYLLDSVLHRAEVYGIEEDNFDEISILNPVVFNNTDTEGDETDSVIHFPICDEDGNICLIFDVIFTGNGYSTTIGADFAPLLDAIYKEENMTILLVQDGYSFYAISGTTGYCQQGNTVDSMEALEITTVSNDENIEEMDTCTLSVNTEYSLLAENSYDQCIKEEDEVTSSTVTGTKSLSDYPIVDQYVDGTQYGLCWAATVASMVRFERPNTYGKLTAKSVAVYMGIGYDEGATNSEAQEALEHYLGSPYVPTIVKDVLTVGQIKTVIDNVDPAYMQCRRSTGLFKYEYHAVALVGYDFTSSHTRIEIMDPAYECFKFCTLGSDGDWTFAFGSYTFTWIKTIRLLYST